MGMNLEMFIAPVLLFLGGVIAGRLSKVDAKLIALRVWIISLIFIFIEIALDLIKLKLHMIFVLPVAMTFLFISGVLLVRAILRFPIILFYIMLAIFILSYKLKILPK